jgi:hypothetical protein
MNSLEFYKNGLFMESILETVKNFDAYTSEKNESINVKKVKFSQEKDFNVGSFNMVIITGSSTFSQKKFADNFSEKFENILKNKEAGILKNEVITDGFKRFSKIVKNPNEEESYLVNYVSVSYNVRVVLK